MTYNPKSEFLQEMLSRGFLQDCTDMQGLDEKLLEGCMPAYIGFDATADSLHIGSLIQIMMFHLMVKLISMRMFHLVLNRMCPSMVVLILI